MLYFIRAVCFNVAVAGSMLRAGSVAARVVELAVGSHGSGRVACAGKGSNRPSLFGYVPGRSGRTIFTVDEAILTPHCFQEGAEYWVGYSTSAWFGEALLPRIWNKSAIFLKACVSSPQESKLRVMQNFELRVCCVPSQVRRSGEISRVILETKCRDLAPFFQ